MLVGVFRGRTADLVRGPWEPPRTRGRCPGYATDWHDLDYSADVVEFLGAIDRYKRQARRPYPSWAEVLAVAKSLGYRKASGVPNETVGEGRACSS